MSKYTTTLRHIYESSEESKNDVINTFCDYNISDYLTPAQANLIETTGGWSKRKLADKIIQYYYFREIGFETWGLFKHYAKLEMKLLMEYYLPMIYSRCLEYDPLNNNDYTETYLANVQTDAESSGQSSSNTSTENNGKNKYSDTPNVGLENVEQGKYLTNLTITESTGSGTGSSASSNESKENINQSYSKNISGRSSITPQKMIKQFRENIIAIDNEIINRLNSLFMGIY